MILRRARELSDAGQHAAVVDYLAGLPPNEITDSPTLALLFGIAHARLGRHAEGARWVDIALKQARERGDRTIEARALNAQGAIALEAGRIDDAAACFSRALEEARRDADHATVGRCSNNLGIIASLRGDYGRAIGSYTMAMASFEQVALHRGISEARHNLGMTYRDQGDLATALATADGAVEEAETASDRALAAQTRAGRAETRILAGEAEVGRREVERALALHRELGDTVGEAEDLRVFALALAVLGDPEQAESTLRTVTERAEGDERPLLAAQAQRDLAHLLKRLGRVSEAKESALTARAQFSQLGAAAEARKLDELIKQLG